tara:strand:+ start:73 stop:252 length:180 start_codon:yes stop_codon:yes gene_type:complete
MKEGYVNDAKFYVTHIGNLNYNFITVPKKALEKIGLKPGDAIEIRTYKNRISIKKKDIK